MRHLLTFVVATFAFCVPAAAFISDDEADKAVKVFVELDGFKPIAEDAHMAANSPYLKRFTVKEGDALNPDAAVGPIEKALLIVDTMETTHPDRVRYAVSYGQIMAGDGMGSASFISLVEVRRYNMGPMIHKETEEEYGKDNAAPAQDFGVGPDVAWRFAFTTVMGNLAMPLAISRKVIAEGDAQLKVDESDLCPAGPCRAAHLVLYDLEKAHKGKIGPAKLVVRMQPGKPAYTPVTGSGDDLTASSAWVARVMSVVLGLTEGDEMAGVWRTPEQPEGKGMDQGAPFITMQIDQNLGNDLGSSALIGITNLLDDETSERWATGFFYGSQSPMELQTRDVPAR